MRHFSYRLYVVIAVAFVTGRGIGAFVLKGSSQADDAQLGEENVKKPYGSCKSYIVGNETPPHKFANGSSFAFYPITDEAKTLFLKITVAKKLYKVTLDGTMMTLEKCDSMSGQKCQVKDEGGTKSKEYIMTQEWNKISAEVNTEKISVMVNSRKVMTMDSFEQKDLDEAQWSVALSEEVNSAKGTPTLLYYVQFDCKDSDVSDGPVKSPRSDLDLNDDDDDDQTPEYSTTENSFSSAAPHSGEEAGDGSGYEMIIVGVVIAAILLVTLAVILYQVRKKRQSANMDLGETNGLNQQQQQKAM